VNDSWTLLGVIASLAVAVFGASLVRGIVQAAREGTRNDLRVFTGARQAAEVAAKFSKSTTHAFVPPGAIGRTHPFGWLWWQVQIGPEEKTHHSMGWALTYRRARKAAGLPIDWKSAGCEYIIAPTTTGTSEDEGHYQRGGGGEPATPGPHPKS
jgi:hypothetical protein